MSFSGIAVINRHQGKPFDIYIGRGTPYGNPFPISGKDTRDTVLRKFETYIQERASIDKDFVKNLRLLEGKRIACSCAPLPCHGHILEAWVDNDVRKRLRATHTLPDMTGLDLESRARELATWAHGLFDQRRSFSEEPYIKHPERIVRRLRDMNAPEEVLAIGWLHDTLEDTILQPIDIHNICGSDVLTGVECLTNRFNASHGNRAVRAMLQNAKLAAGDAWTQTTKLLDRDDNLDGMAIGNPKFYPTYLAEGILIAETLNKADPGIRSKILSLSSSSSSMEMTL